MQINILHTLRFKAITFAVMAFAAAISCTDFYESDFSTNLNNPEYKRPEGATLTETPYYSNRVFVMFSLGFNDLSSFLASDFEDLTTGALPGYGFGEDVVLVLKHNTYENRNYSQRTSPVLIQLYKRNDKIISETLKVFDENTVAASASMIEEVLTYAKTKFPARSYGMLISSHGTGWIPYSPDSDKNYSSFFRRSSSQHDEFPLTKSIGAHYDGSSSNSIEINIPDLAKAIPMHLDYIIFDACYMGGIEVAYELKDKCDKICFSQTEILAEGMDYKSLLSSLFDFNEIDLLGIAENYFDQYKNQSGIHRSATISVVDCKKIESLSQIVAKHSETINKLAKSNERKSVQGYFRSSAHGVFYDLQDIIIKSGANKDELEELNKALVNCVLCKYATEEFMATFLINNHCGLSMYLPDYDRYILNDYYKSLKWNKATKLVK